MPKIHVSHLTIRPACRALLTRLAMSSLTYFSRYGHQRHACKNIGSTLNILSPSCVHLDPVQARVYAAYTSDALARVPVRIPVFFENLENFLNNSRKDRTPKPNTYIQMVCWLWPIYLAWRSKVATDQHLKKYCATQEAAIGTAALLNQPGVMSFGGRDESAMGAAAFYRAAISTQGLGNPGDIVFYYRSGYEQPCHVAV